MNDETLDTTPRLSAADARGTARLLNDVRASALTGADPAALPRPLIGESWTRVLRHGVDPDRGNRSTPLPLGEMEYRRQTSPLSTVLPTLREGLVTVAEEAWHVMVITDAEGRVLWREGSARVQRSADGIGLEPGVGWSEPEAGTNALGTALVARRPVQVHSAEHFVRAHHPWTCAAAPVHDPRTGRLLGVVDVSGPAATFHPATLSLVTTVARLAEHELRERHLAAVERLRAVAAPMLCGLGGRAVVVDRAGWTAAVIGMPPPDRVALPKSLRPGQRWLPGLGMCSVEPLPDGWLLRVDEPAEPGPLPGRVVLDVRRPRQWTLEVTSCERSWTQDLSPRHAELLYVLARHREGRTAAQLAGDLFGDTSRTVTVRAEMSRVRRTLAGVLEHRPYRFAEDVEVRLLHPEHPVDLLPHSTAPVIAAQRNRPPEGAFPAPALAPDGAAGSTASDAGGG